jgi:hypothetical protein
VLELLGLIDPPLFSLFALFSLFGLFSTNKRKTISTIARFVQKISDENHNQSFHGAAKRHELIDSTA